MQPFLKMQNTIQEYAWGSALALPDLLGRDNPEQTPWAELWMGAHPKAPSRVEIDGQWRPMNELIREEPAAILGDAAAAEFGDDLPFLFKVLAVDAPLSIQAHPNKAQAEDGFARDDNAGIPIDDPARNYRDTNHKPEILCALSNFWAMAGFRPAADIAEGFSALTGAEFADEIENLENGREGAIRAFFGRLMGLEAAARERVLATVRDRISSTTDDESQLWMRRLLERYPDDIGVLAPMFLNVLKLAPGEAIYIPSGVLHAYIEGVGVELMANSDNVLRCGLTPKHVDVPELLNILDFEVSTIDIIGGSVVGDGVTAYPTPAREFALSRIELDHDGRVNGGSAAAEILLCVRGTAEIESGAENIELGRGESVLVPASTTSYSITGPATLFRAEVRAGEKGSV